MKNHRQRVTGRAHRHAWLCLHAVLMSGLVSCATVPGERGVEPPARHASEVWNLPLPGDVPFDQLSPMAALEDPLRWPDGRPVAADDWPRRREQLAARVETWLVGTAPPAPTNLKVTRVKTGQRDGQRFERYRLAFGPGRAARFHATLIYPRHVPDQPLPVIVVAGDWYAHLAQADADGFLLCMLSIQDWDDESAAYADLFGPHTWGALRRRAWSTSRAVDWLVTLPQVNNRHIYVAGASRHGKHSLIAAAFDPRIAGVVSISSGSGGTIPYRLCDGSVFGESIEILTRGFPDWLPTHLAAFSGREQHLPADNHLLLALIAPRPVFVSTGLYDWVESTFAIEQVDRLVRPVYTLHGQAGNLVIRYRATQHDPELADVNEYRRFLRLLAEEGATPRTLAEQFPFEPIFDAPPATAAEDAPAADAPLPQRLDWLLGEGPAYEPMPVRWGEGETDAEQAMLVRHFPSPPQKQQVTFGPDIRGNLYFPTLEDAGREDHSLPAIVFLSPLHTASGYTGTYRAGDIAHLALTRSGAAVFAFDPIGTGARQIERRGFYQRHPRWSLMGRMIADARHALDAVSTHPAIDPRRVYLVGYAMGGMTGLLTAASDARPAGVVSIAGFAPWRTDTDAAATGGIARWSDVYGWLPRLHGYTGSEVQVPVDFDQVIAAIAPRPVLVIAPRYDRHAPVEQVHAATARARDLTGGEGGWLTLLEPDDWNRLGDARLAETIAWVRRTAGVGAAQP